MDDALVAQHVAIGVDRRRAAGDRLLGVEQRRRAPRTRRRSPPRPAGTSRGGRRRRRRSARRRSARSRRRTPAGRRRSARTSACPGTSSAVSTAWTPGIASAGDVSIDTMRAYGCGDRSVAPHTAPSIGRSDEKANVPATLATRRDAPASRRSGRSRAGARRRSVHASSCDRARRRRATATRCTASTMRP